MRTFKSFTASLTTIAALSIATSVQAASIGVSFYRGAPDTNPELTNTQLTSDEVAGVVPQPFWNNINVRPDPHSRYVTGPLTNSAGETTIVTVRYGANDSWVSDGGTGTPDEKMMKGIVKFFPPSGRGGPPGGDASPPIGGTNGYFRIQGLNTLHAYDIYTYTVENGECNLNVAARGTTYYIRERANYGGAYVQGLNTDPAGTRDLANYVKFAGVIPNPDSSLEIDVSYILGSGSDGAGVAGLQIVDLGVDTAPPSIFSVQAFDEISLDGFSTYYRIQVAFNKDIDPSTVVPANFTTTGSQVSKAIMVNSQTVLLNVDTLFSADTLTVNNVKGVNGAMIAANSSMNYTPYSLRGISLNLEGGHNDAANGAPPPTLLAPTDVAGVVPLANWNNKQKTTGGEFLVNKDGTPTPVTISYAAEGSWVSGTLALGVGTEGDRKMLQGVYESLDQYATSGGNDMPFFINNVPEASYNLIAYTVLDQQQEMWTVNNDPSTMIRVVTQDRNNWNGVWLRGTGQSGMVCNYVQFDDVHPVGGTVRLDLKSDTFRGRINGLQLIPVTPEELIILVQPADQLNKLANDLYQFSVVVTNLRQPYLGQWYSNGVPIIGAHGPVLNGIADPSGNNAVFYFTATNEINGVQSATALLTVQLNTFLLSVSSQGNCHAAYCNFNLPMNLDGTYSMICSNQITGVVTPVTLGAKSYGSSQRQVVLPVSPDLLPETNTYIVTVTGATAQNGLPVFVPTEVAFVHGSEYTKFQTMYRQYFGIGNIGPAALQASPRYNTPGQYTQVVDPTGSFDTMNSFTFVADNYCGDLFGWFLVPTTGNYTFWMSSDDTGASYIATDANPAHKVQINSEPVWADWRQWSGAHDGNASRGTPPSNGSTPIPLVAGQLVYLEGAFSQGGGGQGYTGTYTVDDVNPPANGTTALPLSSFVPRRMSPNNYAFDTLCGVFFAQPLGTITGYVTLSVTFTAKVDGTPAWAPKFGYWYQWSSNGVPIVGATNATYTTAALAPANNNDQYACCVSNNFSSVCNTGIVAMSASPVLLSSSTLNQIDLITLVYTLPVRTNGTYTLTNSASEFPIEVTIVGYGAASNIVILKAAEALAAGSVCGLTVTDVTAADGTSAVHPNPTVIIFKQGPAGRQCTDFATLPPNAVLNGNAALNADGTLHLTEAVNSQQGSIVFSVGQPLPAFQASYKLLMGNSTAGLADGTSFSFGPDVNGSFGEGGSGSGLTIVFETYAGNTRGFRLLWGGVLQSTVPFDLGQFATPAVWKDVFIELNTAGYVTMTYGGMSVWNNFKLSGFAPLTGNAKFGIGGRTGGENQQNYIDDLCFNDYPLSVPAAVNITPDNPVALECSTVTFASVAAGSPFTYAQWFRNGVAIPGANGPSYTTPKLSCPADNGVIYTLTVTNQFSSASDSSTIAVTCDSTPPTLVSAGSTAGRMIGAQFSEAVDPATATNALNYSVNGAPFGDNVASVSLMPVYNGGAVILTLSNTLAGAFTLTSTNVVESCPGRNLTNSTVAGAIYNASLNATNLGPAVPAGLSTSFTNDDVVITGGGADIWGTSDECRFVYTERAGDFDMKVQVTRLDPTSTWSKGGLDARVLLTANSPHAMSVFTPYGPTNPKNQGDPGANGIDSGIRPTVGGNTDGWGILGNGAFANGVSPCLSVGINWMRLQRTGNTLKAYHSADGVNWTNHASTAAGLCSTLPPSLFVGMVESSHNNGAGAAAVFKNFTLTPPGVYVPLTSCGKVAVSYDGVGNVTLTWADTCCRLQGATVLNSNPALTVWTDIAGQSPVTLPSGSPMQYFRTISP